jgi:hypothetical protein
MTGTSRSRLTAAAASVPLLSGILTSVMMRSGPGGVALLGQRPSRFGHRNDLVSERGQQLL